MARVKDDLLAGGAAKPKGETGLTLRGLANDFLTTSSGRRRAARSIG